MKQRFILLKDSPELKAGAIMEQKDTVLGYGYTCINRETHHKVSDQGETYYTRMTVENQPEWFEATGILSVPKKYYHEVKQVVENFLHKKRGWKT